MSLTQLSARFFLQLAVGLMLCPLLVDRRRVGAGFVRLMALLAVAAVLPALLLHPASGAEAGLILGFSLLSGACALFAGALPRGLVSGILGASFLAGSAALVSFLHAQNPGASTAHLALCASSGLGSTLVLGLVCGAMILGHWYLVTPDLPVAYLGRVTAAALGSLYAKAGLLALTLWLFHDRFAGSVQGLGAAFGLGEPTPGAGFQSQLDGIYLIARAAIGLVGPAVLCHLTLQTVKLKATQPATGILYAATVMVLMGELFAFLGEASFDVVL